MSRLDTRTPILRGQLTYHLFPVDEYDSDTDAESTAVESVDESISKSDDDDLIYSASVVLSAIAGTTPKSKTSYEDVWSITETFTPIFGDEGRLSVPACTPIEGPQYADDGGHSEDLRDIAFDSDVSCIFPDWLLEESESESDSESDDDTDVNSLHDEGWSWFFTGAFSPVENGSKISAPACSPIEGPQFADDGGHLDDLRDIAFDAEVSCIFPEWLLEEVEDGYGSEYSESSHDESGTD